MTGSTQTAFIEDLIDVATGLLNYNSSTPIVNPPTPSINQQEDDTITINQEEAEEILDILKGLEVELAEKDNKIKALKEEKEDPDHLIDQLEELERKVSKKEEEIKSLEQEKKDLKDKGGAEVVDNQDKISDSKGIKSSRIDYDFGSELEKHVSDFDFVTVIIVAGQDCCELSGHLCRVHSDFITIVNEDKELIKIPIDKIAALKITDNGGGSRKSNEDSSDDQNNNQNLNKATLEETETEQNDIAAQQKKETEDKADQNNKKDEKEVTKEQVEDEEIEQQKHLEAL
ncbi:hypothetical protein JCM16358_16270 [Halanaerocella petrolearia]